jgi:UDP-N-acetylglucosamine:LPS N-acetylglucosamine transferase
MEAHLVAEAGFALTLLAGRGIERRVSAASAKSALALGGACLAAWRLLARLRPAAVVTVGGYAGLPCALAAIARRVPLVVINVDAVPGAANRLVAPFARVCAVALPGTPLPHAVCTGAPVRAEVLAVERSETGRARARAALGIPAGVSLVAVTGGSLGAGRLNEAALGLAGTWRTRRDLVLYHVAGERNREEVAARAPQGALDYRVVGYEPRLPDLLAAADVVVSRAGASTIAELTVIGTPSVLVPLPNAPGDHQRKNAERLASAGAARVLLDADVSAERLAAEVDAIVSDRARQAEMTAAALSLGRPDAAARVAELAEALVQGRPPARAGMRTIARAVQR